MHCGIRRVALWGAITLLLLSMAPVLSAPTASQPARIVDSRLSNGTAGPTDLPVLASYEGPLGIEIRSYSMTWTAQADLKAVYDELLANLHGAEIKKLGVVNLYPEGGGGLYHARYFDNGVKGRDIADGRVIDLFGADGAALNDLARTLSHEYGHHFTYYYQWVKEGADFTDWKSSRWAEARGIQSHPTISPNSSEHGWLPAEIAAEDYVQLFGSARARRSTPFGPQSRRFSNSMHNLQPQENLTLPLASEVTGYREYWLGLSGLSLPVNRPPSRPWLQVTGEQTVSGRRMLTLRWSGAADPEGGGLEYTVVSYDDPLALPYGHLTVADTDGARLPVLHRGQRTLRLFVRDDTGLFVSSNPVTVDLSQMVTESPPPPPDWIAGTPGTPGGGNPLPALPSHVRLPRPATVSVAPFSDVDPQQWFAGAVNLVTAAGLIQGYPDGRFQPDSPVRRAEFLAVLMRAYPGTGPSGPAFADVPAGHWAHRAIHEARGRGLVQGYNNRFDPDGWITRAEMAVLLHRFLGLERPSGAPTFSDVGSDLTWARDAVATLAAYGIVQGYPGGAQPTFKPRSLSYRHQVAALLSRLF